MFTSMKLAAAAMGVAALLSAQGHPPRGPMSGPPPYGPPGKVVTGAPYSGVENIQMQQTLADGNQIQRTDQVKVYRDRQGRVRTESTAHNRITIFDPVAGYVAHVNPDKQTATKMMLPASPPPHPHRPQGQAQTEDLGTQTINGLVATGMRITHTIPAGAIGNQQPIQTVHEVWTSTALAVPVLVKTTDPQFGNSTMQLTDVSRAEPDPTLFQIPSTYTVTARQGPPDPPPAE